MYLFVKCNYLSNAAIDQVQLFAKCSYSSNVALCKMQVFVKCSYSSNVAIQENYFSSNVGICEMYNLGQNIQKLFHFLPQFFFTTSETELDYYHQKVNVRVASRDIERPKTQDLRKIESFRKIPEMVGFDGKYSAVKPKV